MVGLGSLATQSSVNVGIGQKSGVLAIHQVLPTKVRAVVLNIDVAQVMSLIHSATESDPCEARRPAEQSNSKTSALAQD